MVNKLKTLKDISRCSQCIRLSEDVTKDITCVDFIDLKQEAIKWYHRSDDDKHKFIREFFNITEEEIKDAKRGKDEV